MVFNHTGSLPVAWALAVCVAGCGSKAATVPNSAPMSPPSAAAMMGASGTAHAGSSAASGVGTTASARGLAGAGSAAVPAGSAGMDGQASDIDAGAQPPRASGIPNIEIGETSVLAPLVGMMYTPAPGQTNIGFYGTDLGRSTVHKGALKLHFGDTWRDAQATAIDPNYDDIQGEISLTDFPDGSAVDAYVAAHPAKSGQPPWQAAAPPVTLLTRDGKVAPLLVSRDGKGLPMSSGRTPVAIWSDGADGLFGIFNRIQPLACASAEPRCPNGFVCDTGLGGGLGAQEEGVMPCVIGVDAGCTAAPSGGYCQDPTSSTYDKSNPSARKLSVAYTEEWGNEDLTQPGHYLTTAVSTNKFINPSARTVADFDPTRRDGVGNVYTAADGTGAHETLFVWGRPWFSGARGRDVRLYLQYMDLPKYQSDGKFDFKPKYFTGVADGVPQFSESELDAKALDLSYPQGDPTTEVYDVAGELSISWVSPLRKWVLLYGGNYVSEALFLMQGSGASDVVPDPEGSIRIRFADHPWGPWTAPQPILRAHTADDQVVPLPSAPKGILARPDCTTPDCPPHEPYFGAMERGDFYSAHMIEPWTTQRDSHLDLYWVVSTWNPYQVVLVKTPLLLTQ